MSDLAIVKEVDGDFDEVILKVGEVIKPLGFGILTRIDFDKKISEKIGQELAPCTILGACHPKLAYEAYLSTSDAALLMPCNIVVTRISSGKIKVEAVRLTKMLGILPEIKEREDILQVEMALESAILSL